MARASTELLVINKMYDLTVWGCERISGFPRDRRHVLGDRLERRLHDILEELLAAKYTSDRVEILRGANLQLEMLRFQLRIAKDLRCLTPKAYGYASRLANEVGCLVGSWIKKESR